MVISDRVCKLSLISLYLLVLALALSFYTWFKQIYRDTHFNTLSLQNFQHVSDHVRQNSMNIIVRWYNNFSITMTMSVESITHSPRWPDMVSTDHEITWQLHKLNLNDNNKMFAWIRVLTKVSKMHYHSLSYSSIVLKLQHTCHSVGICSLCCVTSRTSWGLTCNLFRWLATWIIVVGRCSDIIWHISMLIYSLRILIFSAFLSNRLLRLYFQGI